MSMNPDILKGMIKAVLPDADIELVDTRGDQDHYDVVVTSAQFRGLSKIQQHKLVYAALEGKMGTTLHALSLKTYSSNEGN